MMLLRLVGSVTPLVRELMMLEASDTTDEMAPVADAPTSLVREPTALVILEMLGTEENPGIVGLVEVVPTLMIEDAPLVRDPTPLVTDAIILDSCERIEEMEAVASLWTDEIMLLRLVGLVTPLVRELMMLDASDTTEEMAPVAEEPMSLVREPTALVTLEMIGTEENPGMEVLQVVPTLMIEDAPLVASLRMEEMALVGFTPEVIPVISDPSEDATLEGKTLVGSSCTFSVAWSTFSAANCFALSNHCGASSVISSKIERPFAPFLVM